MPDSPPARRLLSDAMKREPEEPPIVAFDRYLNAVEKSPEARARRERLKRSAPRPLSVWRDGPAYGLALVALLLLAKWVAGLIGLV